MKHLSFRVLFFCIFLPPVLYIFSIQGLERMIQRSWTEELDRMLISDPTTLLEGSVTISDEVRHNVDLFLGSRDLAAWGVVSRVVVRTATGRWLYPSAISGAPYPFGKERMPNPLEAVQVAQENLKIMEEGISLSLTVQIPNNTWLANSVLLFYVFVFSGLLYGAYRRRSREAGHMSRQALQAALGALQMAEERSREMAEKEEVFQGEMGKLQAELAEAGNKVQATEEAALDELEALEDKLQESRALRQAAEKQVEHLREELERQEASRKTPSKKPQKKAKTAMKRFRTLYKNIEFQGRAVDGFLSLTADLQLRAEELIYNLNEDSIRLTAKRKVFSRPGTLTVLEAEFGYKGRIYWRQRKDGKAEVLTIGTKNTQGKDLAYLESL